MFGVGGLSPWSHSAGAYLTKLVGSPVAWHVYVPSGGRLLPLGVLANGRVDVRPESAACEKAAQDKPLYLTFDPAGRGSFAQNCEDALQRVHPPPTLDAWGPKSVSAADAAAGFNMYFTGTNLGASVDVSVNGKSLGMVRGEQGRLMTTPIPAGSGSGNVVRFSVNHRGRSVLEGEVEVARTR